MGVDAANLLRYARRRAGLTQRELSARAGVAQPAIARIERGSVSPRLDTLDRLLSATGHGVELTPRIGQGVDRSLIRAALSRTPEQRVLAAGRDGRNLIAFLNEVERGAPG